MIDLNILVDDGRHVLVRQMLQVPDGEINARLATTRSKPIPRVNKSRDR